MKCEQTEQRTDWYLRTLEKKESEEQARLTVDSQAEESKYVSFHLWITC